MEFRAKEIRKQAKQNFEKTWRETAELLSKKGRKMKWKKKQGKKHSVVETILKFREVFLSFGFEERILPAIIPENEVYRQYGPEAPLILDRVYYLAGLSREEIGISEEKKGKIRKIIEGFNQFSELKIFLRNYKKGKIEADDFIEEMTKKLKISEGQASEVVEKVFPEFKELKPEPTELTLRSHMTASWFPLLSNLQRHRKLPLKLFSIGSRFRREQRQDKNHLYESTSASIVVMSREITLEDGVILTRNILAKLGFPASRVVPKKTTSKYYTPGMDLEVYTEFKGKELEIANLGFYSPVSLANYKIWYPVLNLGFGVERMAMILTGEKDIRNLVYGKHGRVA